MDPFSHRLANVLVGNMRTAATLEMALAGPELEFEDERVVAVTGGVFEVTASGSPVPYGSPFVVAPHARLKFGAREAGARAYLAVEGGFEVAQVLGSRSTHAPSGMGGWNGRALVRGDRVPLGPPRARRRLVRERSRPFGDSSRRAAALAGQRVARVLPGPDVDRFVDDAIDTLQAAAYEVAADSDRIGYRLTADHYGNSFELQFLPEEETDDVISAFLQDEITLVDNVLKLTLGTKLEHNDYTGLEVQPNARILWKLAEDHTLWAAASRSVHTPPRTSDAIRANLSAGPTGPPPSPPFLAAYTMTSDESEDVNTFEAGYRGQIGRALSVDATAFYNVYDGTIGNRQTMSFESDPAPAHVLVLTEEGPFLSGTTWGAEIAAVWKPMEEWTLQANYSYLRMDFRADDPAAEDSERIDREAPRHQIWVRSSLHLPPGIDVDLIGRYVNQRSALDIGSVTEVDARIGWKISANAEVSLVGQNLLHRSHEEINDPLKSDILEVPRSYYLSLTLRF